MTAVKVKQRSWTKVKLKSIKVKQSLDAEDWKILKTFVGLKFNHKEKQKLWPFVKDLYVDDLGNRKLERPNLGRLIKRILWSHFTKTKGGEAK